MSKIKFWKILFLISFVLNSIFTFLWFSKPQEVIQYQRPGEVVVVDPINTIPRGKNLTIRYFIATLQNNEVS